MSKRPEYRKVSVILTPLERVVCFSVSEQTYDRLTFVEQLIVDLKIEGYMNIDIAGLLGVRPVDIKHSLDQIRIKLAKSELQFHLEVKQHYRETTRPVLDESELGTDFNTQNILQPRLNEI